MVPINESTLAWIKKLQAGQEHLSNFSTQIHPTGALATLFLPSLYGEPLWSKYQLKAGRKVDSLPVQMTSSIEVWTDELVEREACILVKVK